jgi:dihydroorotase
VLIRGGRVIDPIRNFDRVADVAITNGKIAAVRADIASASAGTTFDASGKLVVPGLIDIHTHAVREKEDAALCLIDGVTSIVDAGSRGSDRIDEAVDVANAAPNRMRLLINISKTGNDPNGELLDLRKVDVDATRRAIQRHRDYVVGIKVRLSDFVAGKNDLPALKLAQSVAGPLNIPIMIHMGQSRTALPELLAVLKRGDIVTHLYSPPPNGIFGDDGVLLPAVLDARKRGVWFDVGNGLNKHLTWDVAERTAKAGFWPDTISTDWVPMGRADQIFNFGTVLSKFLMLGMPLGRVIGCATANAARVMPAFKGLGTLAVGATADVTVLELQEGRFEYVDNEHAKVRVFCE